MVISQSNEKPSRVGVLLMGLDERNSEDMLASMKDALRAILENRRHEISFVDVYCRAYTMVLGDLGRRIYSDLKEVIANHLETRVRENVLSSYNDDNFLNTLTLTMNDYQESTAIIECILRIMEKRRNVGLDSIRDLAFIAFRDLVLRYGPIPELVRETLLNMITKERRGEVVDRNVIQSVCRMLLLLGVGSKDVYEEFFEKPFLSQTAEFYRIESQRFIAENSVSEYIQKVEACIDEESTRARLYMDTETESKIVEIVEQELIRNHMNTIKEVLEMENSGMIYLLRNRKIDDLERVYKLLSRVPEGSKILFDCIGKFHEQGESFEPKDDSRDAQIVSFNLKCFLQRIRKSPEHLSFSRDELKDSVEGVSERETESVQDKTTKPRKFVMKEDVCERHYEPGWLAPDRAIQITTSQFRRLRTRPSSKHWSGESR